MLVHVARIDRPVSASVLGAPHVDLLGELSRVERLVFAAVDGARACALQAIAHRAFRHSELARNRSDGHMLLGQDLDRHDFLGLETLSHRHSSPDPGRPASGVRGCASGRGECVRLPVP